MVEFVSREDNDRWNENAEWFRKCRQRLHDKFANCKSCMEDCERSGWDMSQGLPTEHWGLATDDQITNLAFEFTGWGITARKVFKLQFLGGALVEAGIKLCNIVLETLPIRFYAGV